MTPNYDSIVIGGGIVGLATAYSFLLKKANFKVLVIEKEPSVAAHQTSHNSGVIHSGIYYKPESLKAQNCLRGYQMLLHFCREENIDFDLCGKLIVASDETEFLQLEELKRRGLANGLIGIKELSASQITEVEPNCSGKRALFVPQTGIVDFKAIANRLKAKIEERGGEICLNTSVTDICRADNEIAVETNKGTVRGRSLVNCAGLFCDRIARHVEDRLDIQIIPFRGEYFELSKNKQNKVRNLIYPVPNPAFPFLGVHFTRMIQGGIEIGPNAVLGLKREAYKKTDFSLRDSVEILTWPGFYKIVAKYWQDGMYELHRSLSKKAFLKAAQKLVPDIQLEDLVPGGAGVRAQACHRDGRLIDDFLVLEGGQMIHLLNAPSPAATASLAIGDNLADRLLKRL